jgi:hypothetical protein
MAVASSVDGGALPEDAMTDIMYGGPARADRFVHTQAPSA